MLEIKFMKQELFIYIYIYHLSYERFLDLSDQKIYWDMSCPSVPLKVCKIVNTCSTRKALS